MELLFQRKKELDEYLILLEEAKKRDHRVLGKELELFTFSQKVGAGIAIMVAQRCRITGTTGAIS